MIFTTKAACRILGRDRKQQADDIATGHCKHVPTAIGGLRYWRTDDLAGEMFFVDQRDHGYSVKMAGALASRLRRAMEEHPTADQLSLVTLTNGNRFAARTDTLDVSTGFNSGGAVREVLMVNVRNLRERVQRLIEADADLVGADDDAA